MTELEWQACANPHAMLEHLAKKKGASKTPLLSWLGFRQEPDASRQLLLFAIACCRRIESLLIDQRSRYALEIAEKLADGSAGRKERNLAVTAAKAAAFDLSSPRIGVGGWMAAAQARAAEAVAALADHDPASVVAALAKEAVRARAKAQTISSPKVAAPPAPLPAADQSWNSAVIVAASPAAPAAAAPSAAPPATPVIPPEEVAWTSEATMQCECLRDILGNPFQPAAIKRQSLQKSTVIALAKRIYDERAFNRLPEIADVLSSEGVNYPDLLAHCRQPREHVRGCWVIDLLLGK